VNNREKRHAGSWKSFSFNHLKRSPLFFHLDFNKTKVYNQHIKQSDFSTK